MPTGNVMEVTLQLRFLLLIVFSLCQIDKKNHKKHTKSTITTTTATETKWRSVSGMQFGHPGTPSFFSVLQGHHM